MVEINKEDFEQFAKENFPEKAYFYGDTYFFIQAGDCLGTDLHYEYVDDKMQLHIEGWNWREIRDFLRARLQGKTEVSSCWWGRNDCAWTLRNADISNWEDVKTAFKAIHTFFSKYIQEFEELRSLKTEHPDEESNSIPSVQAHFTTIIGCLKKNLSIPHYQRPYRWTEHNVEQLLEDINKSRNEGKLRYLVGSVILCKNKDTYDIVDGQQRVTTLLLLIKVLFQEREEENISSNLSESKAEETSDNLAKSLKYNHSDSFCHIRENFYFIKKWIDENIAEGERDGFLIYILERCEFVEVIVKELHEAFQMFESQNGRGKELEAYNLLKAYHLRAMNDAPEPDKVTCDVRWEDSAIYGKECMDLLKQLFNEQLYRTRLWTRGENAGRFNKKQIDEFKGFTLSRGKGIEYVYQNAVIQQEIANSFMRMMNMNVFPIRSRFIHGDPDNMSPFVNINQLILNGKAFFDYVETYIEMYKRLFLAEESYQLSEFKQFYEGHCLYSGSQRSGDGYVREVYKSAIMAIFDRFGEDGVNKLHKDIYVCLYQYRIKQKAIRYNTMANKERSSWIFKTIECSKSLSDLYPIRKESQQIKNSLKREDEVPFYVEEIMSVFRDTT